MIGATGLLDDGPSLRGWLARQVERASWRRATAA